MLFPSFPASSFGKVSGSIVPILSSFERYSSSVPGGCTGYNFNQKERVEVGETKRTSYASVAF